MPNLTPPPPPPPKVSSPGFEPPTENLASAALPFDQRLCDSHLPPGQRHNRKGHQQTARQGSCDQRKKVWQEPNPENPQNYKRGGVQSFRPTHPAEDPPTQTPPPLQNSSYKRSLMKKTQAAKQCTVAAPAAMSIELQSRHVLRAGAKRGRTVTSICEIPSPAPNYRKN